MACQDMAAIINNKVWSLFYFNCHEISLGTEIFTKTSCHLYREPSFFLSNSLSELVNDKLVNDKLMNDLSITKLVDNYFHNRLVVSALVT